MTKAQPAVIQREGRLVTVTGSIRSWSPDKTDTRLLIRTRDEKGLLHKQDLPPVQINRYRKKPIGYDSIWQSNMRRPERPIPIEQHGVKENMVSEIVPISTKGRQGVFPGMAYSQINPADPSIAVGPDHIIQMVNGNNGSALFSILDKQGNTLTGPAYLDQLPGTSHNGGGDGITWYDQFSQRYVMTEFGDSSATGTNMNTLIMAISTTADPLGSWYVYEFYADGYFPDYPKYGNWPGAWFAVTRDFKEQFEGNALWAFDKNAMINGSPVVAVLKYRLAEKDNKYNSLTPVTCNGHSGNPQEKKGYFIYYSDNELTADMQDRDSIGLIGFKADFINPASSSIQLEQGFEVAPFSSMVCESRNCAPSPDGQGYDVVSNKIMQKPYWRDYGSFQSIVLNHTVDVSGNGLSGIRWYELRNQAGWTIHQQGTFSPQTPDICNTANYKHRFLGNIIQNGSGQIALAYNFSSNTDYASIAFTGRHSSDPINRFTLEETILERGTGYGTTSFRWGDYNDMAPDPKNDSLFWFTGMTGLGSGTWKTTIASFVIGQKPKLDAKLAAIVSPNTCNLICSRTLSPQILLSNFGSETLERLRIHVAIDGNEQPQFNWTGVLTADANIDITLPQFTFPVGTSTLKIWIDQPNGQADQHTANDTLAVEVIIPEHTNLPLSEGAETGINPPVGWKIKTDGSSNFGWKIANNAGFNGSRSFMIDNFNNNEPGRSATLSSPIISKTTADSLFLQFRLAAALYDENKMDTLEIIISSACGINQKTVLKKWGKALATHNDNIQQAYIPLQNEWRLEKVDLRDYIDKEFAVIFKVTNQFGNNVYIDDISVQTFNYPQLDLQASGFIIPADASCSNEILPDLIITSRGKDTVTHALIQLWENNRLHEELEWTGQLISMTSDTIRFSPLSIKDSLQLFGVIKRVNNRKDDLSSNDTVNTVHRIFPTQNLPVSTGFESVQETSKWQVTGNALFGWKLTDNGFGSLKSMGIHHSSNPPAFSTLISPRFQWPTADSILLEFDFAAGYNTAKIADTLQIAVSFDCGLSWKTIYSAWGKELATTLNREPFFPTKETDWKKIRIDLSGIAFGRNELLVRFTSLGEGNSNAFLDNINLSAKNVLPRLKQQGYLISPNPVTNSLHIQLFPYAVGLESIQVRDAAGRVKWLIQPESGNNMQSYTIDCSGWASGVYFVTLGFRDKKITEKFIKL